MLDKASYRLALLATILAFFVVILGAYTRLTDAGLGCPDWPGCYGQLTPKSTSVGINVKKAWTEMAHRYAAGLLGTLILVLGILAIRNRRYSEQPFLLPLALVVLVVFQALLGMWTVTLKLFPLVVVAHLLGGLTTLSLLWWLSLRLKPRALFNDKIDNLQGLRTWAGLSLLVLGIQLFLGGWTSANYAALVCLDFPQCQAGQFFPGTSSGTVNILSAFNLTSAGVMSGMGEPLDIAARLVIHMAHRIGALITTLVLIGLVFQVFKTTQSHTLRSLSIIIAVLLTIQILLGITNVLAMLPLAIAVAHNAIAALLLLALITLNYPLYFHSQTQHKV